MIFCPSFTCTMSIQACEANQQLASKAIRLVLRANQSVFQLTDQQINRLLVCGCGDCNISKVDKVKAKEAFRKAISTLADKITRYDEWGAGNRGGERHLPDRVPITTTINRINKLKEDLL